MKSQLFRIPFDGTATLLLLLAMTVAARAENKAELLDARKIWDRAPCNMCTDLIRFKGQWLCCFREGTDHGAPGRDKGPFDGKLRVIASHDGRTWTSAALITSPAGDDLRDAKLSITPDGRLMLAGAAAHYEPPAIPRKSLQSLVWFSTDGHDWSKGEPVGDLNFWLWRHTWHGSAVYSMGYRTHEVRGQRSLRLYRSNDGVHFDTLSERVDAPRSEKPDSPNYAGSPSESTLLFLKDETCLCLLRRDGAGKRYSYAHAQLGIARPPYRQWTWKDLAQTGLGGPHMIELPDGRIVAGTRLPGGPDGETKRTSLLWVDWKAGTLTEFLSLPTGNAKAYPLNDQAYPGLVSYDGVLWVSYYSAHEGKESIYLARVKLPPRE